MTNRQHRGRPPVFDDMLRARYLEAVAAGMRLGPAAVHAGVHSNVPRRHALTDPQFAAALGHAKTQGRKAREEELPHDEARYNNQRCRCRTCRAAATAGRAARRGQETGPEQGGGAGVVAVGRVVELTPVEGGVPPLLLARAS